MVFDNALSVSHSNSWLMRLGSFCHSRLGTLCPFCRGPRGQLLTSDSVYGLDMLSCNGPDDNKYVRAFGQRK